MKRSPDAVAAFSVRPIDTSIRKHKLPWQLVESRKNAILAVPGGLWPAHDLSAGKLEDPGRCSSATTYEQVAYQISNDGFCNAEFPERRN